MKQVIAKFLDSQREKVPASSPYLQVLQPTTQKPPGHANTSIKTAGKISYQRIQQQRAEIPLERKSARKTCGAILVLIGWIFLVLNALMVFGNLSYGHKLPLSLSTVGKTDGSLSQVCMLGLGALVLVWITWSYLRSSPRETVVIPALVIAALGMSLTLLIKQSSGQQGFGSNLLSSISSRSKPVNCFVSGILYSEDKPSAVVGNRIVYEGDAFDGINIVKIHKNKVEFEKNGKRWAQSIETNPVTN